ncbi:C-type lectin domain family 2 member E-like [Lissotriton helveticus]
MPISKMKIPCSSYSTELKSNQCTEHQTQRECVQCSAARSGKDGEVPPPCGDDWIWYRHKCYYFSKNDGNWTEAEDSCAALNSFLVQIDTQEELTFLLSHKGDPDRWIGLRRQGPDQPWMLVNGSKFNNLFIVEDYAECAYLNHGRVKSSECYNRRKWCCKKLPFYESKIK